MDISGNKKKVLSISANRFVCYGPVSPIGVSILESLLQDAYDVSLLDLAYVYDWRLTVENTIKAFKPEYILLSLRNIDNSDYFNYNSFIDYYEKLIKCIRTVTRAIVIIGGPAVSIAPEYFVKALSPDYAIQGSAENKLLTLFYFIEGKISWDSVYNVFDNTINNGISVNHCKERIYEPIFALPERKSLELSFMRNGDMGNIETSRGCAFRCSYCVMPFLAPQIHEKDIETVIYELKDMRALGITNIYFTDNILNYSRARFELICKAIINNGLNDIDYQCQVVPLYLDDEMFHMAKKAGFTNLQFAASSYDDEVLKLNGKNYTSIDIDRFVNLSEKHKLANDVFFTFGLLGDNEQSVNRTVDYIIRLDTSIVNADYYFGSRVFPNTFLFNCLPENKRSNELKDPVFYISEYVEENIDKITRRLQRKAPSNHKLYEILCTKFKTPKQRENYLTKLRGYKSSGPCD